MAYKNPLDPRARAARRRHYERNKEQYSKNNILKKERVREYLENIKNVPCMDCGKSYPSYVMDFDHRDITKKLGGVGFFASKRSWAKMLAEIEKCDIICANCHRERTSKQMKYTARNRVRIPRGDGPQNIA